MIWNFSDQGAPVAPHPVFRLGSFWACETPDGQLALAGKLPWGRLPSFSEFPKRTLTFHSYRGWDAGVWHDGPHCAWDGEAVTACVLPGSDVALPACFQREGFAEWLKAHEVLAWKKSLAKAFRTKLGLNEAAYRVIGLDGSAAQALVLLGLRLAFPNTRFFTLDYPAEFKAQWKRYCQNLNHSTWAAPAELSGLSVLNSGEISQAWPDQVAADFLQQLNARIPFVPGKLAARFNSP